MNEGEFIFHPTMIDFRFIDLYNIFIIFLQSSKMYLILSENIDLYNLISNNYLNTHFILLLVLYVSDELWIVGFSNYQVIDALANHGVAPIGQEQVLSKNQSRSMGKNEKTCFLREFLEFPQITFGWYVDENTTYHSKVITGNSENPHTWRQGFDNTCSWPIGATPWSAKAPTVLNCIFF